MNQPIDNSVCDNDRICGDNRVCNNNRICYFENAMYCPRLVLKTIMDCLGIKDILALHCCSKTMNHKLTQLDADYWLPLIIKMMVKSTRYKRYNYDKFRELIHYYTKVHDLNYKMVFTTQVMYSTSTTLCNVMMINWISNRIKESRKNRVHDYFLDIFMVISTYKDIVFHGQQRPEAPPNYPDQLLKFDINDQNIKVDYLEGIITLTFQPVKGNGVYHFNYFEEQNSSMTLKIIRRYPGTPTSVTYMGPIYGFGHRKQRTLPSKADREHLGEYFKNDKNAYMVESSRSLTDMFDISHGYAKSGNYTPEMQANMQRKAHSTISLVDIPVDIIKAIEIQIPLDQLISHCYPK